MISRNGICYDLEKSEYRTEINGITYVFSSQLHLDKFLKRRKENHDIINYSLTRRFNMNVDVKPLADIVLYKKIETRGFLLIVDGDTKICQNKHLKFGGGIVTPMNFKG